MESCRIIREGEDEAPQISRRSCNAAATPRRSQLGTTGSARAVAVIVPGEEQSFSQGVRWRHSLPIRPRDPPHPMNGSTGQCRGTYYRAPSGYDVAERARSCTVMTKRNRLSMIVELDARRAAFCRDLEGPLLADYCLMKCSSRPAVVVRCYLGQVLDFGSKVIAPSPSPHANTAESHFTY
jgi:hypothetical protein